MQFKVGDTVVHPAYGVGHIVEIEEKELSIKGETSLYYRGTFNAFPKTSVWTPVEANEDSGLRAVTPKCDLDQYRTVLKSRPEFTEDHSPHRHNDMTRRLKEGSFQVMCEVVRDLTIASWQKSLGSTDAVTLKKTLESLLQEWAVADDISVDEATVEIKLLLHDESKSEES